MIYTYNPLDNHKIEKLHNYIEHFFNKMFSLNLTTFDENALLHPEFREVVNSYEQQIKQKLETVFVKYTSLTEAEKREFKNAYLSNNNIPAICAGTATPVKYEQLPSSIQESIKDLCANLWKPILGYSEIKNLCGSIKEHFDEFTNDDHQVAKVCPFCGLESLLSHYDDGRDDYDHYIPKGQYPFNSINFKNLVPMCHKCNSKYKGQIDPVFTQDRPPRRRTLFYPYDISLGDYKIKVTIKSDSIVLKKDTAFDVEISSEPINHHDKIVSWMQVFKIKNRYIAEIKSRESIWKQHLHKKYLKRKVTPGFSHSEFIEDIGDDIMDYRLQEKAIVQRAYYEFIFSQDDLEASLNSEIV